MLLYLKLFLLFVSLFVSSFYSFESVSSLLLFLLLFRSTFTLSEIEDIYCVCILLFFVIEGQGIFLAIIFWIVLAVSHFTIICPFELLLLRWSLVSFQCFKSSLPSLTFKHFHDHIIIIICQVSILTFSLTRIIQDSSNRSSSLGFEGRTRW